MSIFAIADLHLSFGVPEKTMEVFGPRWKGYQERIKENWIKLISSDDLVLIPGDISWAMRAEIAKIDLDWIDALPGEKVMIRGNHDYWWESPSKVKKVLPSSCHIIQNDAFEWKGISIGGTRLWDSPEFSFGDGTLTEDDRKIFEREYSRLEMSLKAMKPASKKIIMTHYPPVSETLNSNRITALLEKYSIDICVFGHLHNFEPGSLPFGNLNRVRYLLTACDYLNFEPLKIL